VQHNARIAYGELDTFLGGFAIILHNSNVSSTGTVH